MASTKAAGSNGARSSGPSPRPTSLTGTPSSRWTAMTIPPLAVPSSLVSTMPVTSTTSANTRACRSPFCPVVASSTSSTSSTLVRFSMTRLTLPSSSIRPVLVCSRPAVSISTTSASDSMPWLTASKATLAGSAPSLSDRTVCAPTRSPQVCNWSTAAADTFRAAAVDQLQTWGDRVGAQTVRSDKEGADPASVAFEAVSQGIESEADVVLIDTAGRLHTKTGLMDELGKVKRVIEKRTSVDEVLLVLDATTGQNGLRQARVFAEVVDVTGIVLTKLDGTAKGGIVIAVQRELGVPVKLVGLGEGPDDLAPFDPAAFVDAILG